MKIDGDHDLYSNGDKIAVAREISFEVEKEESESFVPGIESQTFTFDVVAHDVEELFGVIRQPATPAKMFLSWTYEKFNLGAETEVSDDGYIRTLDGETKMSFQAKGKAFIKCRRCGTGRLYAGFARMERTLPRWMRHVCPRGV